ncbi:MAG: superoxide dismutase family protein [Flavobacteriaceae bacterium]
MKNISFLSLALAISIVACKNNKKEETTVETNTVKEAVTIPKQVTINLDPKSDSNVSGTAIFTEESGKVSFAAKLVGLVPGEHAIHIHESSDCSSPDGKSTGGHWNPTSEPHGKWGAPEGYHKGDIGNFTADESGNATVIFSTDEWCIGCGDPAKDILGKAVIVHAGIDDFTTQPTGDAGGRISCGGIIQ